MLKKIDTARWNRPKSASSDFVSLRELFASHEKMLANTQGLELTNTGEPCPEESGSAAVNIQGPTSTPSSSGSGFSGGGIGEGAGKIAGPQSQRRSDEEYEGAVKAALYQSLIDEHNRVETERRVHERLWRDFGMIAVEYGGDGNCFYHAVCGLLGKLGIKWDHAGARAATVNELKDHKSYYQPFFAVIDGCKSYDEFVSKHALHGAWVNLSLEIMACCNALNIQVQTRGENALLDRLIETTLPNSETKTIELVHYRDQHYRALQRPENDGNGIDAAVSVVKSAVGLGVTTPEGQKTEEQGKGDGYVSWDRDKDGVGDGVGDARHKDRPPPHGSVNTITLSHRQKLCPRGGVSGRSEESQGPINSRQAGVGNQGYDDATQQLINQRRVHVTAAEEDAVSRSINTPHSEEVVVTKFHISMTLDKMACLRPCEYSAVHQL
jgi:hypothetical protein